MYIICVIFCGLYNLCDPQYLHDLCDLCDMRDLYALRVICMV